LRGQLLAVGGAASATDSFGSDGLTDVLNFNLGNDVINTGYLVPQNAAFVFIVTVTVRDMPFNRAGVQFSIKAMFDYGTGTANALTWTGSIIEPKLLSDYSCTPRAPSNWVAVEAGQSMLCTYRAYHDATSTGTAYNVTFTDLVPSALLSLINGSVIASVTAMSGQLQPLVRAGNSAESSVSVIVPNLMAGVQFQVTYVLNVSALIAPGADIACISNGTSLYFSSRNLDPTASRLYALAQTSPEPAIGYGKEPTHSWRVISKSLPAPDVNSSFIFSNIGEITLVEVTLYPIEGTNPLNLTIRQRLATAFALVALNASIQSVGGSLSTSSNLIGLTSVDSNMILGDSINDVSTFSLGTVVNSGFLVGSSSSNRTITVLVAVGVPDIVLNIPSFSRSCNSTHSFRVAFSRRATSTAQLLTSTLSSALAAMPGLAQSQVRSSSHLSNLHTRARPIRTGETFRQERLSTAPSPCTTRAPPQLP